MQVADVMQTRVVTIGPETTLPAALRLARERGIRHLPVMEDGRLVGMVSDRDLKRALPSAATSLAANELTYLLDKVTVAEIMTRGVIVVSPAVPVEEAARRMVDEKISALPVLAGGVLVGLLTETDVVRLFVRALGAGEPSSRIDVRLGEGRSALAEIVHLVEAAGGPVVSLVTLLSGREREAVIRVASIDPRAAIAALRSRGYAVKDVPAR
jgi:acetoin utilization protein AcuB